jgi:hypothetical protein
LIHRTTRVATAAEIRIELNVIMVGVPDEFVDEKMGEPYEALLAGT